MAKEVALKREEESGYQRDTVDSLRNEQADNYQFPPAPADDNERQDSTSYTNIKNVQAVSSVMRPRRISNKIKLPSAQANMKKSVSHWKSFGRVFSATSIIYTIQIFFGVICLVGLGISLGIESDLLLSAADTVTFGTASEAGNGLLVVGMAGAFLCGFISFLVAAVMYSASGQSILKGFSLLVLAVCLGGLLCPIINLLPLMLFWYLYIALAK